MNVEEFVKENLTQIANAANSISTESYTLSIMVSSSMPKVQE